jgi:hypothetical protein
MSHRSQVWNLLVRYEGQWVTRAQIEAVGGAEGTRRLREIRERITGFSIDVEGDRYRLVRFTTSDSDLACAKCGAPPNEPTQPSVDPRWRLGRCYSCRNKSAIFVKKGRLND